MHKTELQGDSLASDPKLLSIKQFEASSERITLYKLKVNFTL
jgi:hypothetical protein